MIAFDLTILWALIVAFAIFAYVVMDGFDLGVGLLFPFFPEERNRHVMMNSIAPVWDGNETWLILGGGGLLAAFPLAYAVLLPALYTPLIAMLLGLIFRGVAFEFRFRSERRRHSWDVAFAAGSLIAALGQGIALGAVLQGVKVAGRHYAGGWWDWLTPFSLLTGVSLVIGYALLGACWLNWRTEGALQQKARQLALWLGAGLVAAILAVSLATPLLTEEYWRRWFLWPQILATAPVPVAVAGLALALWYSLLKKRDVLPFLCALGLFALSFIGLGISMWPDIVPGQISIWDAAAPRNSQILMLIGVAIMMPIILVYTAYSYWVFRGKVDADAGYH